MTPELAEWANQIRAYGNDATHEEAPFSRKDAQSLRDFTHLVLIYLFSLPAMLDEARKQNETPETEKGAIAIQTAKQPPDIKALRGGISGADPVS